MSLPLSDLRIIAVEQYGAGPWGSVHLADLGADVIKIEDPRSRGDVGRYVPPFQEGEDSLFFETFCHNKRSVSLDLTHPEARMRLAQRGAAEETAAAYDTLMQRCDFVLFAGIRPSDAEMNTDLEAGEKLLDRLDKELT